MEPIQPSQDLVTWLLADWRRGLLWAALIVVPLLHRKLSVIVGKRPRPEPGQPWYPFWYAMGILSGAVWADAPGSVKAIGAPMPAGRLVPPPGQWTSPGGLRSGDTPPQGSSGSYARIDPPKIPPAVLVIGFLFAFGSGCVTTAIDKARVEYGRALKAQTQIQSRFKLQQKEHQRKNITRLGIHTPAAAQWQAEWIVKKAPVEDQIRRCQAILDETSDYLLLSDDKRGISGAGAATACVSSMKDQISKLFDGGL
jgi:hypothetical protein